MLEFLKAAANRTQTENGAVTYISTESYCLDLFATIGALRGADDQEIILRFQRAYAEDPLLAMKILFFARDIRGGLGERRVFRLCFQWLAEYAPGSVEKNVAYVAEFGRWDDLLTLMGTGCEAAAIQVIREQLAQDRVALQGDGTVSLLGKWLPSVNASNAETVRMGKALAQALGMREMEYRKLLTALRSRIRIMENNLREKDYTFDYSQQPSKAMFKYRKAFLRNDRERYNDFLEQVSQGNAKLNTATLTPYDIIAKAAATYAPMNAEERRAMDVTWNAQQDFTDGENALVVVDGSGSMYWGCKPTPAAVALSLGIYFAQRNTGIFHNHFITFSTNPRLVEIQGNDIYEQVRFCKTFDEVANTDLQKVFQLILNTAVANNLPQCEMPSKLYIISDMEFDSCAEGADMTNFAYAKALFQKAGYELPQVVFWNVCNRNLQQPVTKNEQGVTLVSGCSPRIFGMLSKNFPTPMEQMMDILNQERYAKIAA